MLITLGVAVAQLDVRDFSRALWTSLAKAGLCAIAALSVVAAFGLSGAAAAVLVIQAIIPVAVTNYLLATRYDADPRRWRARRRLDARQRSADTRQVDRAPLTARTSRDPLLRVGTGTC